MEHRSTFIDITGKRFGRWTVLAEGEHEQGKSSKWVCKCDCGTVKTAVLYSALTKGNSMSCGCLRKEKRTLPEHVVHSQRNPTYRSWQNMMTRCYNYNHPTWKNYGERGIGVCDNWRRSFDEFLLDMGARPEGGTLDRIDNDKGYCKENCKWSTKVEQSGNRRSSIKVEWRGEIVNLIDVARLEKVDYPLLRHRVLAGQTLAWAVDELRNAGKVFHERAVTLGGTPNKTGQKRARKVKLTAEQNHADIMAKMYPSK